MAKYLIGDWIPLDWPDGDKTVEVVKGHVGADEFVAVLQAELGDACPVFSVIDHSYARIEPGPSRQQQLVYLHEEGGADRMAVTVGHIETA